MGDKANILVGVAEITLGVGVDAIVLGYTVDGVAMTVTSDFFHAKVEEAEGTLIRKLIDQEVKVTLNMAEGTLENLAAAIPGASLDRDTLTLGGGDLQEFRLTLKGTSPSGRSRVVVLDRVNPTGEVSIPYKKGGVSVVPMAFSALVDDDSEFGTKLDASADPPELVVGDDTKSSDDGLLIEAQFDGLMADPEGKHLEFWFTEVDEGVRAFSDAALKSGDDTVIELTVEGDAIAEDKALALYYRLGTVTSDAGGILESFSAQTVVKRPIT